MAQARVKEKPGNGLSIPGRTKMLAKLERVIRVKVKDYDMLNRAMTHRSFSNEHANRYPDNERLEYLGDSVLGLIVNEYLFKHFENYLEGDLAKIKSTVVSEETLALTAREFSLGDYLLLGKGEENSGGRTRDSILANTLEALIGAIYLSSGIKPAREFILGLLKKHIETINRMESLRDPKTALQEMVQKKYKEKPLYDVVDETGPDHLKEFTVRLMIKGKPILDGKGSSKRRAEMDAARSALEKLAEGVLNL
jgi:ribonuclease III